MAATVTVSNIKRVAVGDRFHVRAKVVESGTYSSGGSPVTAASLGLRYIESIHPSPPNAAGIHVAWDQTAGTSVNILTYDENDISGVEAQFSGTAAAVYSILAIGF
jgi:hypothetical protein